MAKYSLDLQETKIDEIALNSRGDKIFVSPDDANLWRRFVSGYKTIMRTSEEFSKKLEELDKENEDEEILSESIFNERVKFSEKAKESIEKIFGEGTVKKLFAEWYEKIPDFVPDEGMFLCFLENITPIMEEIFKQKMDLHEKNSKARMEKYKPLNYRKPGEK